MNTASIMPCSVECDDCPVRHVTIALCGSSKKHRQSFHAIRAAAVVATRQPWRHTHQRGHTVQFGFVHLNYDCARDAMILLPAPALHDNSAAAHVNKRCDMISVSRGSGVCASSCDCCDADDTAFASRTPDALDVDVVLHKISTFADVRAEYALQRWCAHADRLREQCANKAPLVVLDALDRARQLVSRRITASLLRSAGTEGCGCRGNDGRACHAKRFVTPPTFAWYRKSARLEMVCTCAANRLQFGLVKDCNNDYGSRDGCDNDCDARSKSCGPGSKDFCCSCECLCDDPSCSCQGPHRGADEAEELCPETARWWVVKPEEGSGSAFAHHLVIWHAIPATEEDVVAMKDGGVEGRAVVRATGYHDNACASCSPPPPVPPLCVHSLLPAGVEHFVVQPFYMSALPVVVKVYCIDAEVFADVRSTAALLQRVQSAERDVHHVRQNCDCVVCIDSQDGTLFGRPGACELAKGTTQIGARVGADHARSGNQTNCSHGSDRASSPDDYRDAEDDDAACNVAHSADCNWSDVFAAGTQGHAKIHAIAAQLSSRLGLTLFGFDVLLLPQQARHQDAPSRRARQMARGGIRAGQECCADGVRACPCDSQDDIRITVECRPSLPATTARSSSSVLLYCTPVIVDVNYFPGYKGVECVGERILRQVVRAVR